MPIRTSRWLRLVLILSVLGITLSLSPDRANAEDLICFTQAEGNQLFVELTEHRQMCPLIENENKQLIDRLTVAEREIALKEQYLVLLREEIALKDKHIESIVKLSEAQEKQCQETIKKLKPTFFESARDTILKILIGVGVGAALFL